MKDLNYYLIETLGIKFIKFYEPVNENDNNNEIAINFLWVHLKIKDISLLEDSLFNNILAAFHNELAKANLSSMTSALLEVSLEEWLQCSEEISTQTQVIIMDPLLLSSLGQKPQWPFIQIHSPEILSQQPHLKKQAWLSLQQIIKSALSSKKP